MLGIQLASGHGSVEPELEGYAVGLQGPLG